MRLTSVDKGNVMRVFNPMRAETNKNMDESHQNSRDLLKCHGKRSVQLYGSSLSMKPMSTLHNNILTLMPLSKTSNYISCTTVS